MNAMLTQVSLVPLHPPQVRELLQAFGNLKAFNLVTDKETGISRGYAFCEYSDHDLTDVAIQGLSSIIIGGKGLTVRRANNSGESTVTLQQLIQQQQAALTQQQYNAMMAAAQNAMNAAAAAAGAGSGAVTAAAAPEPVAPAAPAGPCVVRLAHMVEREELLDDEDYEDMVEDTREEVSKYGKLLAVVIPKPSKAGTESDPPGVGLVFLKYEDPKSAERAQLALNGRKYGENNIQATFFDAAKFEAGQLE